MDRAAEIHDGLKHPVIDGDGHWMEPIPIFLEYLCEVGGPGSVDQMRALWRRNQAWYRANWQERQHNRMRRTIWWGVTSNTLDKATALLPALLNERLPELGIDFALIYPRFGSASRQGSVQPIERPDCWRRAPQSRDYSQRRRDPGGLFFNPCWPISPGRQSRQKHC